jgi:hypothetical protein
MGFLGTPRTPQGHNYPMPDMLKIRNFGAWATELQIVQEPEYRTHTSHCVCVGGPGEIRGPIMAIPV